MERERITPTEKDDGTGLWLAILLLAGAAILFFAWGYNREGGTPTTSRETTTTTTQSTETTPTPTISPAVKR